MAQRKNMIIRECQESDIQSLYKLNKNEMGYDYPQDKMMKQIDKILHKDTDKIFVAIINNKVVGYIHVHDYDLMYNDHLKNILGIAVSGEYRHQGIGKALLHQAEIWAKETNAKGIRLVSGETRTGAHELYKHCGYQFVKNQCNFIKKW